MIKEIAFFVYPVSSVPRARRFYEGALGLKLESNFQGQWLEYDVNGTTFAIATKDKKHQPARHGGTIAFEVDDLEGMIKRLRKRRVRFVQALSETPVCRFATVADPDGNQIIIHQRKA